MYKIWGIHGSEDLNVGTTSQHTRPLFKYDCKLLGFFFRISHKYSVNISAQRLIQQQHYTMWHLKEKLWNSFHMILLYIFLHSVAIRHMGSMGQDGKAELSLWLNKHNCKSLARRSQICRLPVNLMWASCWFYCSYRMWPGSEPEEFLNIKCFSHLPEGSQGFAICG